MRLPAGAGWESICRRSSSFSAAGEGSPHERAPPRRFRERPGSADRAGGGMPQGRPCREPAARRHGRREWHKPGTGCPERGFPPGSPCETALRNHSSAEELPVQYPCFPDNAVSRFPGRAQRAPGDRIRGAGIEHGRRPKRNRHGRGNPSASGIG